jgi:hypothetical protein
MTETPPPPPPDEPSPPPPSSFDPRRPMFRPAQPPSDEPAGCGAIVGRILLGTVSFVISIVVFMSIVATASSQPWIGVAIAAALVAGLFVIRKRAGPSPLLGAVVVGVTVAFVVFGGCMLLLSSFK